MSTASIADVQANLGFYLSKSQTEGPVVIVSDGKPIGVLLTPYDEDDAEQLSLARSPQFQAILERSRQSIAEGKGLSSDDFWRMVNERAIARDSAAKDD